MLGARCSGCGRSLVQVLRWSLSMTFRRVVAFNVIASMALTGCSSSPIHYAHPDLHRRSNQMAHLAAVIVDVSVLRAELLSPQLSNEWSERARTNLRNALAKHFGSDPRLAIVELDPKEGETAKQESNMARQLMGAIPMKTLETAVSHVDCLPGPALALADAAGTGALLLVYARDRIRPVSTRAAIMLAVPIFLVAAVLNPTLLGGAMRTPKDSDSAVLHPLAEQNAITLCLVDARKGDVSWLDIEFLGSTQDLLDASDVDRLVGAAYAKFKEATRRWFE